MSVQGLNCPTFLNSIKVCFHVGDLHRAMARSISLQYIYLDLLSNDKSIVDHGEKSNEVAQR
jgi:hypothetical protein